MYPITLYTTTTSEVTGDGEKDIGMEIRILSGAALKAHSYKLGCYNATYRSRQADMFESDELQTIESHENMSESQACGDTDRRLCYWRKGLSRSVLVSSGELEAVETILEARECEFSGDSAPPCS